MGQAQMKCSRTVCIITFSFEGPQYDEPKLYTVKDPLWDPLELQDLEDSGHGAIFIAPI